MDASEASQPTFPWMGANESTLTYRGLIAALDKAYIDPQRRRRAPARVNAMRQRNNDEALLNADGTSWHDDGKKSLLGTAYKIPLVTGSHDW
jgi:hypothetical protein